MEPIVEAVKTTQNAAPETGVEKNGTVAPQLPTSAEVDLAAELEAVRTERDNYKKGLLKAKGKLPEEDDLSLDEKIEKAVEARMINSKDLELEAREKALTEKILKENRELKLATQNRSQVSVNTGQGTSIETVSPTSDNFFSAEQLAELKRRKLDPNKVKENILKNRK